MPASNALICRASGYLESFWHEGNLPGDDRKGNVTSDYSSALNIGLGQANVALRGRRNTLRDDVTKPAQDPQEAGEPSIKEAQ